MLIVQGAVADILIRADAEGVTQPGSNNKQLSKVQLLNNLLSLDESGRGC